MTGCCSGDQENQEEDFWTEARPQWGRVLAQHTRGPGLHPQQHISQIRVMHTSNLTTWAVGTGGAEVQKKKKMFSDRKKAKDWTKKCTGQD